MGRVLGIIYMGEKLFTREGVGGIKLIYSLFKFNLQKIDSLVYIIY